MFERDDTMVELFLRWCAALSVHAAAHRDERGDVPGWVLITVMTAGLVTVRLAEPVPQTGATDGWQPFRLVLEVAPGWHVQANPASE